MFCVFLCGVACLHCLHAAAVVVTQGSALAALNGARKRVVWGLGRHWRLLCLLCRLCLRRLLL